MLEEEKSKSRQANVQLFSTQSELSDLKLEMNGNKSELTNLQDTLEIEQGRVMTAT